MENKISRNQEHELIMTSIYVALIYINLDMEFSLENIMSNIYNETPFEDISLFSKGVVIKSLIHLKEILDIFQDNMPKWDVNRLPYLQQAILVMSYGHYKFVEDVDKKIVIDVAIKLSKKFLDIDDYKFVNAILDKVL